MRQSQNFGRSVIEPTIDNEELRAKIKSLQYEVDGLKQEKDFANIQHDKALRDATVKAEEELKRAQTEESRKVVPVKKYDALQAQLQEARDQQVNTQAALDKELRKAKEERRVAVDEAEEAKTDLGDLERQFKHAMQDVETKHAALERTIEDLRTKLVNTSSSLETSKDRLAQKEADAGQLESENLRLKAQTGDADTLTVIKRELSEQVAHIRRLESTNQDQNGQLKIFRHRQKAVEVVEEEKRALEARLSVMEDVRKELRGAQLQRQILEDERRSWTSYLQSQEGGDGKEEFVGPEDMARALVKERLENASLVEKMGALQPEVMEKDGIIRGLEEQLQKIQEELQNSKANPTSAGPTSIDSRTKKALERQRALATKEVEFLREQLRTFDSEEQTYHSEENQFDALKTRRIEELEQQVDTHRRELASLTNDISTLESQQQADSATAPRSPLKRSRNDEDEAETERLGQLSRKNRKLQDDLSSLQSSHTLLQTEHKAIKAQVSALQTSAKTRVLSLRANPTSDFERVKLTTLTTLKQENRDLLAKLEERYNNTSTSTNNNGNTPHVPPSTLTALRLEIQDLQTSVAEKEKRMLRLKQIWAAKSLEFREAVFSLLGWRMDFRPGGKFALSLQTGNHTSEDGDGDGVVEETLIFDGENGTMKVAGGMDSGFAREVRPLTREWVEGKRYIPGLMASVLLSKVGDGTVVM